MAALGDIYLEKRKYRKAVTSYQDACNQNIAAMLNGSLCSASTSQSESGSVVNGQRGSTTGQHNQQINCQAIGTNPKPLGLNQ